MIPILSDREIENEADLYNLSGLANRLSFENFLKARLAGTDPEARVRIERLTTPETQLLRGVFEGCQPQLA